MFLNIHEYEKLFAKRQVALHTELVDCNPVLQNRIDTVGEPYGHSAQAAPQLLYSRYPSLLVVRYVSVLLFGQI